MAAENGQAGAPTLIGYARTSRLKQEAGYAAQLRDLERLGCRRVFQEQISAVAKDGRPQLEAALDYLREGDVFVVPSLTRFARSLADAVQLEQRIAGKGCTLKILDPDIDVRTAHGRLLFNIVSSVAQFEREIMLERQVEGIAKAQAEGKYKGRKPSVRGQSAEILLLHGEGLSNGEIARRLTLAAAERAAAAGKPAPRPVHRANIGRVIKAAKEAAGETAPAG